MKSIVVSALGLVLAVHFAGLPSGTGSATGRLEVAELPAGEVVRGLPVKEREEPEDNDPAADQARHDTDVQRPDVEQPTVADPADVIQREEREEP